MAQAPAPVVPLLHRFLGIGLLVLAAVFAFVRARADPILEPDDPAANIIVYVFAGLALILITVARLALNPRVPRRGLGMAPEVYWSQPAVAQKVFAVWFTLEGAAIFTLLGYLMTGSTSAAVAASVAIIVFWVNGPQTFDRVQG